MAAFEITVDELKAKDVALVRFAMSACCKYLSDKDIDFMSSLNAQLGKKGSLSDKQWPWVVTLMERAHKKQFPEQYEAPKVETVTTGAMHGLIRLFKKAAPKLKYPAILLATSSGTAIRLYLAGPNSKTPGFVQIVRKDDKEWLGRVSPEGEWEMSREAKYDSELAAEVNEILLQMSVDPAKTAAAYGHATGRCCFCQLPLKDERSVTVGYGKVCAENYSLPWGEKKTFIAEEV